MQKVKKLIFPVNTTVPYVQGIQIAINLTPKGIYAKLSVSRKYLMQMGPTNPVIPENPMTQMFYISCRMP